MKPQRFRQVCVCSLVGLLATVAQAQTTWYVDDNAPNDPGPGDPTVSDPDEDGSAAHPFDAIQEGINAAVAANGDDVLVLDGTYTGPGNKDLDFAGKAITVRSENGPDNCIIDCEASSGDPHRGFYFHGGETETSVVDGFTIRNGYVTPASPGAAYGGGIYCDASSPTITNCTITGNTADWDGGGICCYTSSPAITYCTITGNTGRSGGGIDCGFSSSLTITHCTISGNTAAADRFGGGICCGFASSLAVSNCTITGNIGGFGGGIYCQDESSSSTITNCTITGNTADWGDGGGIYTSGGSNGPAITNCTIARNTAVSEGGGIYCDDSSPTIANCAIRSNTGSAGGGVCCLFDSDPMITNCTITENDAIDGGGIYGLHSDPTITNCTILGNTADNRGGGIYCHASYATISNCTIMGNIGNDYGGGIDCINYSYSTITDCILWENAAPQGPEIAIHVGELEEPSVLMVSYSDVQGGEAAAYVDDGCGLVWGAGNIDADPLFVLGPAGFHYLSQTAAGQTQQSPCVDAGSDTAVNLGLDLLTTRGDEVGDASIVDMGYHYPVTGNVVIHVDDDATLGGDGATWSTAYRYLQDALDVCTNGDVIAVAGGSHKPDQDVGGNVTPGDRAATFQLVNGVAIYGGYAGLADPVMPYDHDIASYETTLSGDLLGDDGPDFANNGENSYHVVTGSGVESTAVLDGFTIAAGNANGPFPDSIGGGLFNDGADSAVSHCIFTGNFSAFSGGGMANWNGSSPSLANCVFSGNSTSMISGGAMLNYESSPTIASCDFEGNSAGYVGAMYNYVSQTTLEDCSFHSNSGGALDNSAECTIVLTNCSFKENLGRAINQNGGTLTLTHCTVRENSCELNGGGINASNTDVTLTDSAFSGNWAGDKGGALYAYNCNLDLVNCLFSGNSAAGPGGAIRCFNDGANPVIGLANCTFTANSASAGEAIAFDSTEQQSPSNAEMVNCIFWNGGDEIANEDESTITIDYSDIQGGWTGPGENNIDADPLFVIGPGGCYYLSQTAAGQPEQSPCVDAGSDTAANLDLDTLTTRTDEVTDAGMVDMGYHYPVLGTGIVEGDLDFDGDLDLDDLDIFVAVLLGTDTDPCRILKADINGDGSTNGLDIQDFVDAFLGP